ncbi:MAG: DUF349 domain-containing protein [Bacteroidetes bacterium]|nr:DUF349 domain-containing protein [Bacteroidota bacterium]
MKTELITKVEELLGQPEASAVAHQMRTLQKEYQQVWTAEFEKAKQEFIDEGGKAKEFEYAKSPEDLKITQLFDRFEKKKKEEESRLAAEQGKNLEIRKEIIAKINDLSQVSENVGSAIKKLIELQAQWKATGAVSPHKYKDIQGEYSKAIEEFNYKLSISKQLQDHDLKRNFELKTELLEKLKAVQNLENIKEAERLIKVYRNDWEDIGPVPNDKWDELKGAYRAALEEVYGKLKAHYNSVEEQKEQNLNLKKELLDKTKDILARSETAAGAMWNTLTNELLAIQNEWKNIGRAAQKDNDKVWSEFRSLCDTFFDKKKAFFAVVNEKMGEIRAQKKKLIEKAEAIKNDTDWSKTGLALIRLQDDWKKIPHAGGDENSLFQRFRAACNHFFEAKKAHFEGIEASYTDNLKAKEDLLEKLNAFTLGDDNNANREQLKQLTAEWNAAGMVPMKEKKRVNDAFYNKLDELYDKMSMSHSEKMMMQFKTKLERFASSDNALELLRKENDFLKKHMDEINNTIRTYENNLGFFKNSKGKNDLLKDVEQKIENEKQKLQDFNEKRKMVSSEMNKLREQTQKA